MELQKIRKSQRGDSMKSIGIMGGTFNPIHIGHLIAAEEVSDKMNLDKVIFIPVGNPPHKEDKIIADSKHRLEMVKLATKNNSKFFVSEIEINRDGITFTYDTLIELHKIYKETKIYFIIGFDTLKDIDTWKRIDDVCKLCSFIVVNRNNISKEMSNEIEKKKGKYKCDIHVVDIPNIEVSSTNIRERISLKRSIKYIVTEKVSEYIYNIGLYRSI
jgi:nicotinate-nucleotide adenylyltransferase